MLRMTVETFPYSSASTAELAVTALRPWRLSKGQVHSLVTIARVTVFFVHHFDDSSLLYAAAEAVHLFRVSFFATLKEESLVEHIWRSRTHLSSIQTVAVRHCLIASIRFISTVIVSLIDTSYLKWRTAWMQYITCCYDRRSEGACKMKKNRASGTL